MKSEKPLVSVLICAYNCEKYIAATVKSVQDQNYDNIEILILDNNSADDTVKILNILSENDDRIKIYSKKINLGPYGGLNFLLNNSHGEFIAIQDHDDLWHGDKLSRQVDFLLNNEKYIGCSTGYIVYYEYFKKFNVATRPEVDYYGWHPALLFRRTEKRYDEKNASYADYDFERYILCENKKLIYNLKEPYSLHRMRNDFNNLSNKWVNLKNIKNAFSADNKSFIEELWFIYSSLMPKKIVYFLSIYIFSRRNYRDVEELKKDDIARQFFKYLII